MPYKGHASPWLRSSTENEAYKDSEHEIRKSYWLCFPCPCVTDDVWRYKNRSKDKEIWVISEEEKERRWHVNEVLMQLKDAAARLKEEGEPEAAAKAEIVKQKDVAPEDELLKEIVPSI